MLLLTGRFHADARQWRLWSWFCWWNPASAAGRSIDIAGRNERALLAILAMPPGKPRSREKLAGLLWSDRSDKQARDSLKQALQATEVIHQLCSGAHVAGMVLCIGGKARRGHQAAPASEAAQPFRSRGILTPCWRWALPIWRPVATQKRWIGRDVLCGNGRRSARRCAFMPSALQSLAGSMRRGKPWCACSSWSRA